MKQSKSQINAILAKGMGVAPIDGECVVTLKKDCIISALGCPGNCKHLNPIYLEYFSWAGFGELIKGYQGITCMVNGYGLKWNIQENVLKHPAEEWPQRMALTLASHFSGEQIELEGEE